MSGKQNSLPSIKAIGIQCILPTKIQAAISSEIPSITDVRDVDKNRRVGVTDLSFIHSHLSSTVLLHNIVIPVAGSSQQGASPPTAFGSLFLASESNQAMGVNSTPPLLPSSAANPFSMVAIKITPVSENKLQTIKISLNPSASFAVSSLYASKRTSNASPDDIVKSTDDFFHGFGKRLQNFGGN